VEQNRLEVAVARTSLRLRLVVLSLRRGDRGRVLCHKPQNRPKNVTPIFGTGGFAGWLGLLAS
jgi:hypothetical protein